MTEIRAIERFHGEHWQPRRTNADLIVDLHALGYIDGNVCDLTYGLGKFWTKHRPTNLTAVDLDPDRAGLQAEGVAFVLQRDFRNTGLSADHFDTVVLDPPYKVNGTSTGKGPAEADQLYGVNDAYVSIVDRHQLIHEGIDEAIRICRIGGHLIVKCQDQVSSGRVQWQTREFADYAEAGGCRLVDMLHVQGCRAQPKGRRQVHARRDYSTALVLRKVRP